MKRESLSDLLAFVAVARARSFTRAAAQLGVSQSSLSHTVRAMETRLGVRLLTRTTRSVSPTEAGQRLLQVAAPRLDEIDLELAALKEMRDQPAGMVRISTTDYVADTFIWPKVRDLLLKYPELKIEVYNDYALSDIVAGGFDMGVRLGDAVAKDMIAVRISEDSQMSVVCAPSYLKTRKAPRTPDELTDHNCINLRLPTHGGLLQWELKKGRRMVQVRVEGQVICNGTYQLLNAALAGHGLAYVPTDIAQPHVDAGRLAFVLEDWSIRFPGFHVYYPSRRQSSRALTLVVDALRYRK